ncbi:thioesterase superfamily protein [Desulfatibacillum aliphaticivorans]|uniref:Thioesterase superfamily protein n=1 Tax=Desulfatibacillum aliphaticivorans TaxID=218208 RepID=B8FCD2_DESAL|nr:PaaI family thioesterase [Desulfatibacillum aliphaticivorans]ACL05550.1 thioesterase superfamily protein [Desulfatibacillum aliphaticivorans]
MKAINHSHIQSVLKLINEGPFFRHLSMAVTELGPGVATVEAEISRKHMNPFGALHGGVYSSLIDTAAFWSAYCDLPEDQGLVSIDLKVDFLAPVLGPRVVVKGKRLKSGKTIYLAQAEMFDEKGRMTGYGTSKLMVAGNKQTMSEVINYVSAEKLPSKFIGGCHAV